VYNINNQIKNALIMIKREVKKEIELEEKLKTKNECVGEEKKKQLVPAMVVAVLVIILLIFGWKIFDNKNLSDKNEASVSEEALNLEETKKASLNLSNKDPEVGGVVEKVSRLILLPDGEITVATVKDADTLRQKDPKAFQYVKNGDKLLISQTGIIIYDPILDKIVDVAH
jgi:hypothetical protein